MTDAAKFAPGVWEFQSSEGFDEYMKAVGVGLPTRMVAKALKPTNEFIISDDGEWTLKTSSTFKNNELKFKLGEPFDEATPDGRKLKTTCTVEGNTLIQDQKGNVDSVITRTFNGDALVITLKAKDVVCTRHYLRKS